MCTKGGGNSYAVLLVKLLGINRPIGRMGGRSGSWFGALVIPEGGGGRPTANKRERFPHMAGRIRIKLRYLVYLTSVTRRVFKYDWPTLPTDPVARFS